MCIVFLKSELMHAHWIYLVLGFVILGFRIGHVAEEFLEIFYLFSALYKAHHVPRLKCCKRNPHFQNNILSKVVALTHASGWRQLTHCVLARLPPFTNSLNSVDIRTSFLFGQAVVENQKEVVVSAYGIQDGTHCGRAEVLFWLYDRQ